MSVLLLWLVFRNVSIPEIISELGRVPLAILFIYLAVNILVMGLMSIRWQMLAMGRFNKKAVWHFFIATMIGNFYGLFLPSTVGGDVVKWAHLSHLEITKKKLIFSVLVDRMMGMTGMFLLATLAVLAAQEYLGLALPPMVGYASLAFLAVLLVFFLVLAFPQILLIGNSMPFLNKIMPKNMLGQLAGYFKGNRRLLIAMLGLSLINHIIIFTMTGIVGQAVGMNVSLLYFLVFIPLISMVVLLPISFSGFGAGELAFVYFFSLVGVPAETVLVLTSLMVVFKILLALLGWLAGLVWGLKPKE